MSKILNFIKGSVQIEVCGYLPERFLNLCQKQKIQIWNLRPVSDGYVMEVSVSSFWKLKPLLRKSGTTVHILKKRGLPFLCFRYRKRKCFFAGIVLCGFLVYILSSFIWDIEITGNLSITDQTIKEYLEKNGAGYGALKENLQTSQLEKLIRDTYPEIIWVSITIEGTRLLIDLQETMSGEKQQSQEEAQDLIAPVDGTVTSIVTRSGKPLVEAGAQIKKGDILVSGCISYLDDSGEVQGYGYVCADADVWIESALPYEESFPNEQTIEARTGKIHRWWRIYSGNRYFEFGIPSKKCGDSIAVSRSMPLVFGKNMYLPFSLQSFQEEIVDKTIRNFTKEEIQQTVQKKIMLYCKKLEKNGFQIQQKNVKIKFNEKTVDVYGTFDVSVRADCYQKTEQHTLENKEGQETNGIDTGSDGDSD